MLMRYATRPRMKRVPCGVVHVNQSAVACDPPVVPNPYNHSNLSIDILQQCIIVKYTAHE